MKYPQILYPGKSKNLKDLIWFSNIAAVYPNFDLTEQVSILYLDDEEKMYSSSKVKSNPETHNWMYNINPVGFRGGWSLSLNTKKIGLFGCSITLGQGVPEEFIFSSIIEKHYNNIECLNFGTAGASIQRIAKIISAAVNLINFDIVVITLPPTGRFSFIHDIGMLSDILPNHTSSPEYKLYNVLTQDDLDMYASDAMHWIAAELKNKKVLWSSWCPHTYSILQQFVKDEHLLPLFPNNDNQARDNNHPGPVCHQQYANQIIQQLDILKWTV